jgi:cytochrome b6-f complex iron-sulfur subunit
MAQQRRTMIQMILGGGFAASFAAVVYPALRFVNPPAVPEAAIHEVTAGRIQDFKPDSGKIVRFGNRPALLVRVGENDWRAFSAICTHLNCTVQYRDANRQIWCACHNGIFDLNGKVVGGPAPAPLEQFAVNLRGDEIVISRRT